LEGQDREKQLALHEQIDVEPGGWLYKDTKVRMQTSRTAAGRGFVGGVNLFMSRFTGPGRVALPSMYVRHSSGR